jgi:type IV secretory pathway VirB4 component
MSEQLEARLTILTLEMETVIFLRNASEKESPKEIAATQRELELRREISRAYRRLCKLMDYNSDSDEQVMSDLRV